LARPERLARALQATERRDHGDDHGAADESRKEGNEEGTFHLPQEDDRSRSRLSKALPGNT
jgi:hypothetical protein